MDLSAFYAAYRADGHGRAAYEPSVMVTLILYAFATGVRSSRAIERHCRENVAFRVITGNLVPDHVTIARFICRHQQALGELFGEVLKLCHRAELIKPGVVSIDGTRIAGNANPDVNFQFEQIAREVLAEVMASDEAEDERFGEARGDELPERLRTPEGRREFFGQVRQELRDSEQSEDQDGIEEPEAQAAEERPSTPEFCFDSGQITDAGGGRRRWLSEAKRQIVGITRIRLFAPAWSGYCCRCGAWRPTFRPSGRATKRMRPTASRGGCATVVASVVRPIGISRRRFPRAR
jgi:transposase